MINPAVDNCNITETESQEKLIQKHLAWSWLDTPGQGARLGTDGTQTKPDAFFYDPTGLGGGSLAEPLKSVTGDRPGPDGSALDQEDRPVSDRSLLDNIQITGHAERKQKGVKYDFRPSCGTVWIVKKCPRGHFERYVNLRCMKRTCPVCAKKRREEFINQYWDWVNGFKWPIFITMTMPRCPKMELAGGVQRIVEAFHKLRRQKWWKVRTGFWCVEVVEKEDGWHIHLHCLADAVWVSQKKLSESWEKLTKGYIVDVRRVKNKEFAMLEMFKYISKLWDLSEDGKILVEIDLKKKRFINFFGEKPKIIIKLKEMIEELEDDFCPICGAKLEIVDVCVETKDFFNSTS